LTLDGGRLQGATPAAFPSRLSTDNGANKEAFMEDLSRAEILQHALAIVRDYKAQNLSLTLRQLYYQFVARGLLPSGQSVYSRIGDTLTNARYDGTFPIEAIIDRGRDVHIGSFLRADALDSDVNYVKGAASVVNSLPEFLIQRARWADQDVFVSVWVEKQALEGVIEPICEELGVSWFACKGYPSVSALWEWLKLADAVVSGPSRRNGYLMQPRYTLTGDDTYQIANYGSASRAVVLYFGDHDPDGWEIPRSAHRNLGRLASVKGIELDIEFHRIALNMGQIEQHNPPPFEAKMSSARYAGYVAEHNTQDAWELDALDPILLRDLIRDNVAEYFDEDVYARSQEVEQAARSKLRETMDQPGWLSDAEQS
jgi:hypothetical protein